MPCVAFVPAAWAPRVLKNQGLKIVWFVIVLDVIQHAFAKELVASCALLALTCVVSFALSWFSISWEHLGDTWVG